MKLLTGLVIVLSVSAPSLMAFAQSAETSEPAKASDPARKCYMTSDFGGDRNLTFSNFINHEETYSVETDCLSFFRVEARTDYLSVDLHGLFSDEPIRLIAKFPESELLNALKGVRSLPKSDQLTIQIVPLKDEQVVMIVQTNRLELPSSVAKKIRSLAD